MNAPSSPRKKRTLALVAVGLLTVGGGAALAGGKWFAATKVEERLQRMATAAGLTLTIADIAVSPLGTVAISGMTMKRADGSTVVGVDEAIGTLSPLAAAQGSRRPETITVTGLTLDVRVVDGKPAELFDLYRAARSSAGDRQPPKDGNKAKKRATSLRLDGGEIALTFAGKGADVMPKGLAIHSLAVHFDPDAGIGEMSADIDGAAAGGAGSGKPVPSKLQASLKPADESHAARVVAKMTPVLRVALPTNSPLARWIDAVVVRGFGYDGVDGPSIDGIELHRGGDRLVRVERVATASDTVLGVRADGIAIAIPTVMLTDLLNRTPTKPGGPRAALAPSRPSSKRSARTAKRKRSKKRRKSSKKATKPPAKRSAAKPLGPPKKTAAAPASTDAGLAKTKLPKWLMKLVGDRITAKIGSVSVGTDDPLSFASLRLRVNDVDVPLIHDLLRATVTSATVSLTRPASDGPKNGAGGLRAWLTGPIEIAVDTPRVDLVLRPERWNAVPHGSELASLIARTRRGPVAGKLQDDDGDDDADTNLPPEAAPKQKKKRRKSPRQPYTAQFAQPLHKLHKLLLSVPDRCDDLLIKLNEVAALKVEVTDGQIGLRDPVGEKPFAALTKLTLQLTEKLSDGSRGLEVRATPNAGDEALGTLQADVTTASDGKLNRLKLTAEGPSFARILGAVGATTSVKDDAELSVATTIKRGDDGGLRADMELSTKHIGINWWRLAPRPIDDFSLSASATFEALKTPAAIRLTATKLTFGDATATALLQAHEFGPGKATVQLKIDVPAQDCGQIAASIPASMLPTIGVIEAEGTLGMRFDLSLPLHKPYKGKLDADLVDNECTVTKFGELDVTALAAPFSRPVNESGTILEDQLIGPKSEAWVDLTSLPPWVPYAMIATEDAAFYHHRGVRLGLLSRAIKMCLDHGRFVYGGSTITQQLIKNIYLTRDKNLARKFEELLIVWQIERSLLDKRTDVEDNDRFVATKDRLLELYINGIEFGPNLYGITRGAREYFGKEPAALSPLEAAFLAANKPCPKCGHKRFTTRKWTPWWQERMVSIMSKMRRDGIITEDEFAGEAPYVPRFLGWPGSERKAPGSSIGGVEE